MKKGSRVVTVMLVLGVLAVSTARAIIIRHDLADADYIVADADYPALVDLFRPNDCIGTLVHESYLLTVAHCAADLSTGLASRGKTACTCGSTEPTGEGGVCPP